MSNDGPHGAPPGAKPFLPPPSAAAVDRADRLLARFLSARARPEAATSSMRGPAVEEVTRTVAVRRYDATLAYINGVLAARELVAEASIGEVGPDTVLDEVHEDEVDATHDAVALDEAATELSRPPPGAPTIRPSVPAYRGPERVDAASLDSMAEAGLLMREADGASSFDIAFNDDVFRDLACRITVRDGEVVAIFRVGDVNTRRLLEAEAPRLVAQLEARGLKVSEVRVEVE